MTLTSTLRIHDTFEQLYPYFAIKKPYYDMACTHQVPSDGLLAQLIQILIAKARTNNRISRSYIGTKNLSIENRQTKNFQTHIQIRLENDSNELNKNFN